MLWRCTRTRSIWSNQIMQLSMKSITREARPLTLGFIAAMVADMKLLPIRAFNYRLRITTSINLLRELFVGA